MRNIYTLKDNDKLTLTGKQLKEFKRKILFDAKINPYNIEHIKIVMKNLIIYEMTLEDLEVWEGFDKIYLSYLRFPETLEFNLHGYGYRKNFIRDTKQKINACKAFINRHLQYNGQKESSEFINKRKELLEKHLKELKKIRNERLKLAEGKK